MVLTSEERGQLRRQIHALSDDDLLRIGRNAHTLSRVIPRGGLIWIQLYELREEYTRRHKNKTAGEVSELGPAPRARSTRQSQ